MDKSIAIVASSEFFNDPRVLKESVTAKKHGFDVDVFCYQYNIGDHPHNEVYEGVNVNRLISMSKTGTTLTHKLVRMFYIALYNIPEYIYICSMAVLNIFNRKNNVGADSQIGESSQKGNKIRSWYSLFLSGLITYFFANIELYASAKSKKYDIYHSTDLPTLLAGCMLKMRNGGKLVYDTHELWIDSVDFYPKIAISLLRVYEGFLIRYADVVVTVNESIADELVCRYNIPRPRVILNCPEYEVSRNTKVGYDDFRILYHGVFIKERGLENSILAMKYTDDNCKLYLRGYDGYVVKGTEGEFIKSLKNIVESEGLSGRVTFLPVVDMVDLVKSIDCYDIGIVPYIPTNLNQYYASPNKTFEYMMGGLAVLTSNIPEQCRFVSMNGVGVSFDPYDPKDIAFAINSVVRDIPGLDKKKQNALYFAKNKYNWDIEGGKLAEIYKSIA
jgi:glycosyltransferase involved in cell wall biosynthesis